MPENIPLYFSWNLDFYKNSSAKIPGEEFSYSYPNGDQVQYTVILMSYIVKNKIGDLKDSETKSLRYFSKECMPKLALPYPKEISFK